MVERETVALIRHVVYVVLLRTSTPQAKNQLLQPRQRCSEQAIKSEAALQLPNIGPPVQITTQSFLAFTDSPLSTSAADVNRELGFLVQVSVKAQLEPLCMHMWMHRCMCRLHVHV